MKYVKPYGRSSSDGKSSRRSRTLTIRSKGGETSNHDFEEFYKNSPEFLIGRVVSELDKIAAKPKQGEKPTARQYAFRETVGTFVWAHFSKQLIFQERLAHWKKLWNTKLHPYGSDTRENPPPPKGKKRVRDERQGRLFAKYFGNTTPDDVDASTLGARIEQELFVEGTSRTGARVGGATRARGKIAQQANTMQSNVQSLTASTKGTARSWDDYAVEEYRNAGDVAHEVIKALETWRDREKQRGGKLEEITPGPAFFAKILYDHYARVFSADDDRRGSNREPPPISVVKNGPDADMFALHEAICDYYQNAVRSRKRRIETLLTTLPKTMDALFAQIRYRRVNQVVNDFIRLGKVIHYTAGESANTETSAVLEDKIANVTSNFPDEKAIQESRYWSSAGLTDIKRNEAFVRIWRTAISHAAHGLRTWIFEPGKPIPKDDGKPLDPLLGATKAYISSPDFSLELFKEQARLYFGDRAKHFEAQSDEEKKRSLELMRFALSRYRNASFHFKGMKAFVESLQTSKQAEADNFEGSEVFAEILKEDVQRLSVRNRAVLESAQIANYAHQRELDKVYVAISRDPSEGTIVPRFNRMLQRADNAWGDSLPDGFDRYSKLPPPRNQIELKVSVLRAQYVTLKLIYETDFRLWLKTKSGAKVQAWINTAVERANLAAKSMNDPDDEFVIMSKMAGTVELHEENDTIETFHDLLAEQTATVSRLQDNYENDKDKMSRQSSHIDDLRTDVFVLAFEAYITERHMEWLLTLPEERDTGLGQSSSEIEKLPAIEEEKVKWRKYHARLYAVLHLMPAVVVNSLAHQIRKWQVLQDKAGKVDAPDLEAIRKLLNLYLSMRDDKFLDGESVNIGEMLEDAFASSQALERVLPSVSSEIDEQIPIRGLREMLRSGSHELLMQVYTDHPITIDHLDKLDTYTTPATGKDGKKKSRSERLHTAHEQLHAKWVKEPKKFTADQALMDQYDKVVRDQEQFRAIKNFAQLHHHLRLYRLMMDVVGRMVDFAGVYERDLYFVLLAILHRNKLDFATAWETEDQKDMKALIGKVKNGNIFAICPSLKPKLKTPLGIFFNDGPGTESTQKSAAEIPPPVASKTRNDLAHFNILVPEDPTPSPPDLTDLVNQTRHMMAYDRKVKNSITTAVKDLFEKYGLELTWQTDGKHQLCNAEVKTTRISHLGGKSYLEARNSKEFVAMVSRLL